MEPFFLRCETCQARLRVRDEKFLGQIQACPKCGSMVHILAPAGWLAAEEVASEAAPEIAEVTATPTVLPSEAALAWVRDHALVSSAGAAAVVVTCGLVAFLTFGGDDQVAAVAPATPTVAVREKADDEPSAEPTVSNEAAFSRDTASAEFDSGVSREAAEPAASHMVIESAFLPLITPESVKTPEPEPQSAKPDPARTLTLEPVESKPPVTPPTHEVAATEYAEEVETEGAVEPPAIVEETPQVDVTASIIDPPARRTNIADQLSVPIDSIELPAMPIGEFVNLASTMAAVPIKLDPKVLGDVGLSSRSTVNVHGENTTVGKLLAVILREHQLTCVERDGVLVVVKAKNN